MEFIFPTKDEVIEFFDNRHGFFSVLDISTAIVVPKVQRSTPLDEEWKHIRKSLHKLKAEGFLLVEGEGGDIYHEKFSSTPDRIERYKSQANLYVSNNASEISKSIKTFLSDKRYPKMQRSFKEIKEHYPALTEAILRTQLTNAGALRYRAANNTELWGRPVDNPENIKPESVDSSKDSESLKNYPPVHIAGDYVAGDKVGREKFYGDQFKGDKNIIQTKTALDGIPLWLQYTVGIVTILGFFFAIYTHFVPNTKPSLDSIVTANVKDVSTSTVNISDILTKYNGMSTSLERRPLIEKFSGTKIIGSGTFADIDKLDGGTYLVNIRVDGGLVSCSFEVGTTTEQKLLLLKKNQNIDFDGIFINGVVYGGGWTVNDCNLLK